MNGKIIEISRETGGPIAVSHTIPGRVIPVRCQALMDDGAKIWFDIEIDPRLDKNILHRKLMKAQVTISDNYFDILTRGHDVRNTIGVIGVLLPTYGIKSFVQSIESPMEVEQTKDGVKLTETTTFANPASWPDPAEITVDRMKETAEKIAEAAEPEPQPADLNSVRKRFQDA